MVKTGVQFPTPLSDGSQPPKTPAPRVSCPLWSPQVPTLMHLYTIKKKISLYKAVKEIDLKSRKYHLTGRSLSHFWGAGMN